jgi:hypothetical protein
VLVLPVCLPACGDDDSENARPHVTLDEASCAYEGDKTPKAPAVTMDITTRVPSFSIFEVDALPTYVTSEEAEAFFDDAQEALERGEPFPGVPQDWHLNRRAGFAPTTGSMLVGDPTFPEQMLIAGQRYVVWCSTGEPPTSVFFAAVLEPALE